MTTCIEQIDFVHACYNRVITGNRERVNANIEYKTSVDCKQDTVNEENVSILININLTHFLGTHS